MVIAVGDVAFTPKGGCPLKLAHGSSRVLPVFVSSIHPQGWVPIETPTLQYANCWAATKRSIHPQGWVPIETRNASLENNHKNRK